MKKDKGKVNYKKLNNLINNTKKCDSIKNKNKSKTKNIEIIFPIINTYIH